MTTLKEIEGIWRDIYRRAPDSTKWIDRTVPLLIRAVRQYGEVYQDAGLALDELQRHVDQQPFGTNGLEVELKSAYMILRETLTGFDRHRLGRTPFADDVLELLEEKE